MAESISPTTFQKITIIIKQMEFFGYTGFVSHA